MPGAWDYRGERIIGRKDLDRRSSRRVAADKTMFPSGPVTTGRTAIIARPEIISSAPAFLNT